MHAFLPDGIGPWLAGGLIAFSIVASAISATTSIGGGSMMLTILALVLPQPALVPVHGILQLGSNFSRLVFMRRHLPEISFRVFAAGAAIGSVLGGSVAVHVPQKLFIAGLGAFILWSVWGRMPGFMQRIGIGIGGFATGIITMFIGATGPFVGAIMRPMVPDRRQFVAAHAGCMSIQHTFKLVVFGVLGFAYGPYLPLLAAMVAAGALGSYLGRHVLMWLGDERFQLVLKAALTLAALRLIWSAVE
jgi:uncharacterized membrane protein YfcA